MSLTEKHVTDTRPIRRVLVVRVLIVYVEDMYHQPSDEPG